MPICLSNCITFNYFDLSTNISKALDLKDDFLLIFIIKPESQNFKNQGLAKLSLS